MNTTRRGALVHRAKALDGRLQDAQFEREARVGEGVWKRRNIWAVELDEAREPDEHAIDFVWHEREVERPSRDDESQRFDGSRSSVAFGHGQCEALERSRGWTHLDTAVHGGLRFELKSFAYA